MELVVGLVASLIGTTGIIGIITAGVQLGERARLRRSLAALREASENVSPESYTREMLQHAIATDTLRLAGMSIVTLRAHTKYYVFAFLASIAMSVLLATLARLVDIDVTAILPAIERTPQSRAFAFLLLTLAASYTATGVVALSLGLQREREWFVAVALTNAGAPYRTRAMKQVAQQLEKNKRAYVRARARKVRKLKRRSSIAQSTSPGSSTP